MNDTVKRACNPNAGDYYERTCGSVTVTSVKSNLITYVHSIGGVETKLKATRKAWKRLVKNTIRGGVKFEPASTIKETK